MNYRTSIGALALSAVLLSVGCKTTAPTATERKAAISSMKKTHDSIDNAGLRLEAVNSDLDRALVTTDLNEWYKDFDKQLAAMQATSDSAKRQWWGLRDDAAEYMVAWDKEIAEVSDKGVAETMEKRKERVSAAFDGVIADAKDVSASYEPYLTDLNDINKALKMDLTPNGVNALKPAIEKAKTDGHNVTLKLDKLNQALDHLTGRLATTGPVTAPATPQ